MGPSDEETETPSGTLNLLFGQGANPPSETGLRIASNGRITFAPGQKFPGTSTITGVTAGTDLTGGGTTGNVTLNLNTAGTDARYAQLAAANSFTASQIVTGNVTASGAISGGVVNASTSFDIAGTPFALGNHSLFNAYIGFAGNTTTTGSGNTAQTPCSV